MAGKAYWIAHVGILDREGYQAYRAAAAGVIAAHGGRFLALGGAQQVMEGQMRAHTVIVEFPSIEAARRCYLCPEYQATIQLRAPAAIADLCILEGSPEPL